MPLSQSLVPTELATAFSITPEPYRTMTDVTRASQDTLSNLRTQSVKQPLNKLNGLFNGFKSVEDEKLGDEIFDIETEENVEIVDGTVDGSDLRKLRRVDSGGDDSSTRMSKRPRLVWTPQLHKRFVEVVAHLGVKSAVPKTIMQLMNVEGLTRENVASHLQKYRLYLKRMQGLSNEGPSSSDHLFDSTPVPQSFQESSWNGNGTGAIAMAYASQMVPMPYHGFEMHSHQFNMMMQQRDWSGNKFGSVSAYQQRYQDISNQVIADERFDLQKKSDLSILFNPDSQIKMCIGWKEWSVDQKLEDIEVRVFDY
ncbi:hypothetical protein M8C21_016854 [Ambrosia artemisiifolia]|uniref:HTH myb-type domain-containing protein n=1 Tax=Ambrosia artemisiifolia TaxID=4212 RepID=A0AAD5C1G5_AMBAR|nr:hypothetical protein M8C21_016854 [Ambrosia artemisiifolia]